MSDDRSSSRRSGRFPTTHWSLVGRAAAERDSGGTTGTAALAELIRSYLPALRAHLVGPMRFDSHRADDLLQGFLADKVLEQNMLALADPDRGKFRTFLLTALERFVIDTLRRDSARKRSSRSKMLDIDEQADRIRAGQEPSDAFDRAWAGEVLGEVMRRMHHECQQSNRSHLWMIFEARMLLPITDGTAPPSHDELASRLKLESATQSANALGSAKRLFTRNFREVVSEYAAHPSEVDSEIRELWEIFSRQPA
jgi:DNA-directed RNA polymerase specialized sigma24 family protein